MKKALFLCMLLGMFLFSSCTMDDFIFSDVDVSNIAIQAEQQERNYSIVDVDITGMDSIDKLVVSATTSYDGVETTSVLKAFYPSRTASSYSLSMDFKNFGKFKLSIDFYSQGRRVKTEEIDTVGVIADEYNLAALSATFPVLYFTSSIWEINYKDSKPIPTVVYLERSGAYNWNNLPENVYALPYALEEEIKSTLTYHTLRPKMAAYIADLYELDPSSKFNLYISDDYGEVGVQMLYANGIPEDQFTITLLSDGVGSYNLFNAAFNTADATAKYNEMVAAWEDLKTAATTVDSFSNDLFLNLPYRGGQEYSILKYYTYIMANEEENIEWWLPRVDGTLVSPDATFLDTVKASPSIKLKNINTMLTGIISNGHERDFKRLYSFNNEMFEEAESQNKDVMLILGTRTSSESYFDDYVAFVKSYYGDDYAYYYKGHPATPTGMDPDKLTRLEALDLIDVESSIPAELILFFYPDIHFSGYPSTTYQSAQDSEKAHVLFNTTKAGSASYSYASLMDIYISHQSDGTYLVEYSASSDTDVWDPATASFL